MTFLKVILIIAAVIFAIGMIPLRVRVKYRDELELKVGASLVMLGILPKRERKVKLRDYTKAKIRKRAEAELKPKKEKKPKKKKASTEVKNESGETPEKKKKSMTVDDILKLISVLCEVVGGVFGKLGRYPRVDLRTLYVKVATDDAAKTAQTYGIVAQAMIFLREIALNRKNFVTHHDTHVGVEADFSSDKMQFDVDVELSLRIWHILSIGLGAAMTFVKRMFMPQSESPKPTKHKKKKRRKNKKKKQGVNLNVR